MCFGHGSPKKVSGVCYDVAVVPSPPSGDGFGVGRGKVLVEIQLDAVVIWAGRILKVLWARPIKFERRQIRAGDEGECLACKLRGVGMLHLLDEPIAILGSPAWPTP